MRARARARVRSLARSLARARIVIFLNPQEKAYCNNPRSSDSKPAVHSMYLSYPTPPPPPFISNPPARSSITGCRRSTSYTLLLTRYKSHAPLNRTNAALAAFAWNSEEVSRDVSSGGFFDGSGKNEIRRWKTAWVDRCQFRTAERGTKNWCSREDLHKWNPEGNFEVSPGFLIPFGLRDDSRRTAIHSREFIQVHRGLS